MTEPVSPTERDVLAASLALGLLAPDARAEALRLQLRDPEFARLVAQWQDQADAWLEDVEPQEVDPASWENIADAVFGSDGASQAPPQTGVSGGWRGLAIAASATAILLAGGLALALLRNAGPPPAAGDERQLAAVRGPENVAQIADDEGAPLLSAIYNPDVGTLALRVADFGRAEVAPELWVIDSDGMPRSLGMIEGTNLTIALSPELRALLVDGATMAITLEPRDGQAPHDAPTGDILGTATLQALPNNSAI